MFAKLGGRHSWTAMGLLWLLFAMNGNMRTWIIGPLQPEVVREFDVTPTMMGLFVGALTVAQGIFAIPIASWTDRGRLGWARKYRYVPIVLGYVGFSVLTGFGFLSVSLLALFVLQFVQKVFSGAGEVAEVTQINEWWPVQKRGFAQGLHHTAYPWGTFIGGLAIAGILSVVGDGNWRIVFLTLPLISLPLLFAFWKFSTKPRYDGFVARTITDGETPPLGETAHETGPAGAVGRALRNPNVMVTSIVLGLALAVYTGISFWLPLYLAFISNYSTASIAALSVVFTITGGVGQILWGFVSDKLGRKLTLILLFVWLMVAVATLQFVGIGLVWLIVLQLFLGVATNGVYPILYAMTADSIEPGAIGTAISFNVAGQVIAGLGPVAIGLLISFGGGYSEAGGFVLALYFMAALMALCAVLMLLFTRETIGWFKHRDKALVSQDACLKGALR